MSIEFPTLEQSDVGNHAVNWEEKNDTYRKHAFS